MVLEIHSVEEFAKYLQHSTLVTWWSAEWCGPCKAIAPFVVSLASKYPNIKFIKINIDTQKELASRFQIASIPSFITFKNGKLVERVSGANPAAIEKLVVKLTEPSTPNVSTGRCPPGYTSLKGSVTKNQLEGLNVKEQGLADVLISKKGHMESDCDEQMILSVPFNASVKLHSIELTVQDLQKAPKMIKLFINQAFTFDDVDSMPVIQEIELTKDDYKPVDDAFIALVEVKFVKFQKVPKLNVL